MMEQHTVFLSPLSEGKPFLLRGHVKKVPKEWYSSRTRRKWGIATSYAAEAPYKDQTGKRYSQYQE